VKLVVAIVSNHDVGELLLAFSKQKIRSTKLASSGGFLREGNTTLLLGVEDEQVQKVLNIVEETCSSRVVTRTDIMGIHESPLLNMTPLEVEISGATVFILPMENMIKY
jgi:uncharacterized protein YaaQ